MTESSWRAMFLEWAHQHLELLKRHGVLPEDATLPKVLAGQYSPVSVGTSYFGPPKAFGLPESADANERTFRVTKVTKDRFTIE